MESDSEPKDAHRLLEEARSARARGDTAGAKAKLRATVDSAKRAREPRLRAVALEGLAEIALAERDALRGRTHWDAARDAFIEAGDGPGVARAVEGGATMRAFAGDRRGAAEVFQRAEELHRSAGNLEGAQRCRAKAIELGDAAAADGRGRAASLGDTRSAQASSLRPQDADARNAAFLELLGEATSRLADPRGAASEDAILVALKGAIALTGAERGFVASRSVAGEARFVLGLDFRGHRLEPKDFKISQTVVRTVVETGRAFMANDLKGEERTSRATSVNELGLRSALCAPLSAAPAGDGTEPENADAPAGVLYVDARAEREYGSEDLRFFENVANCVSALYRSARLRDLLAASHARIVELNKKLEEKVERQGVELEKTRADLIRAREELSLRHEYPEIIGKSQAVAKVLKLIDRVADTAFPVLLEGDSGTGKEIVARAIHKASLRREKPFLSLNCAAVAGGLIESELFGHMRGAFTGALADRAGLFELAHGGTLLLDEVGEMSKEMQASLLRVLQEGEIRRVGGKETRKVDVRVIAATNRDLQTSVRDGIFREDLYYRLAVLKVRLPALRERKEDVPALFHHFLAKHSKVDGHEAPRVDADALEALTAYDWPGNVREVENAARWCVAFAPLRVNRATVDKFIQQSRATAAPAPGAAPAGGSAVDVDELAASGLSLRDVEKTVIEGRLRALHWHQKKTAGSLGIDRKTLYRKIREFGLAIDAQGSLPPPEDE
jgi:transcriptional regulator with GAF, ATPase, and Fis domain